MKWFWARGQQTWRLKEIKDFFFFYSLQLWNQTVFFFNYKMSQSSSPRHRYAKIALLHMAVYQHEHKSQHTYCFFFNRFPLNYILTQGSHLSISTFFICFKAWMVLPFLPVHCGTGGVRKCVQVCVSARGLKVCKLADSSRAEARGSAVPSH